MTAFDTAFVDELLAGQIDLLRFEAGTRARILAILNRLQAELATKLMTEDLTAFGKARTQSMLKQATETIDSYYLRAQGELDAAMGGAANVVATHTATAIESSLTVQLAAGLPTETFLSRLASNALILGAPSSEWWSKQSQDTAWRFAAEVRQGVAAGETNEQIVGRIVGSRSKGTTGVMEIARSNARALVHTSIQAVANEARMETYRKNADVFECVQWLATLDDHTCVVCAARDLQKYTIEDDPPEPINGGFPWNGGPGVIHWGCRCIATGVTKTFKQLGVDLPEPVKGERASDIGPVSAGTSFEKFLKRRGKAFTEENLGPGRAELFLSKKLTLDQLLTLDGNRMTLAQLKAKYV